MTNMGSATSVVELSETLRNQQASSDLVKLVRKLRWIGLDDEARCVQSALCTIPPEERASVLSLPNSTD
jgi:hypothetical protein